MSSSNHLLNVTMTNVSDLAKCQRQSCGKMVSKDQLRSVGVKDAGGQAHVCQSCWDHYSRKSSTSVRRPQTQRIEFSSAHQGIPKQTALAQRGDLSAPQVVAIGSGSHQTALNITNHIITNTPIFPPPLLPKPNSPLTGYQDAHRFYNELRALMSKRAYQGDANAELVPIRVSLEVRLPGRKNPVQIGFETLGAVPVRTGVNDLHHLSFYTVIPTWFKWSFDYPATIQDTELRSKSWILFTPQDPDINALENEVFVEYSGKPGSARGLKHTGKKFKPPKNGVEIILSINEDLYWKGYNARQEKLTENTENDNEPAMSALSLAPHKSARRGNGAKRKGDETKKTKKRTKRQRKSTVDEEELSPPDDDTARHDMSDNLPSLSAASNMAQPGIGPITIPRGQIQAALLCQIPPVTPKIASLLNQPEIVQLDVQIFSPSSATTILEVLSQPDIFTNLEGFHRSSAVITFRKDVTKSYGTFKVAHPATIYPSPFSNGTTKISLKQMHYTNTGDTVRKLYSSQGQLKRLLPEINNLGWGQVLLSDVYQFIQNFTSQNPNSSQLPMIPQLRYVQVMLAISQSSETSPQNIFMVEEEIPVVPGSNGFRKYINNNSAKARTRNASESEKAIGEFLEFCQHVQLLRTNNLAYVSDLQGCGELLTDPQIITNHTLNPDGEQLFAQGNTNFSILENEHVCGMYCRYFQLKGITVDKDGTHEYNPDTARFSIDAMRALHI